MTLQQYIHNTNKRYAADFPEARFIGYNTACGSQMYGTLNGIPRAQLVETPVAENLMMGLAFGMALKGYRPVVCFERHDFLLLALDCLVNHVDKLPVMSGGQYKLPIVVRAIVGGKSPLNAGPQHTQDYSRALRSMLKHTPVYRPASGWYYNMIWQSVGYTDSGAIVVVEYKDLYNEEE